MKKNVFFWGKFWFCLCSVMWVGVIWHGGVWNYLHWKMDRRPVSPPSIWRTLQLVTIRLHWETIRYIQVHSAFRHRKFRNRLVNPEDLEPGRAFATIFSCYGKVHVPVPEVMWQCDHFPGLGRFKCWAPMIGPAEPPVASRVPVLSSCKSMPMACHFYIDWVVEIMHVALILVLM